jgi:diguanylate cyclase (GGDEF)-like protein
MAMLRKQWWWNGWLGNAVTALALAGALATAMLSLNRVAEEANSIEREITTRSVEAAIAALLRNLGETHSDYAVWDDAVRALYGAVDESFVDSNYAASTATATFFDTVYLLDENQQDVFGFHAGAAADVPSQRVFGPALSTMIAKLRSDLNYDVQTAIVRTPWGLGALAIGPVVPNTPAVNTPGRTRLLVISKAFDAAAVHRLAEDYVIPDLRLSGSEEAGGVALTDPSGDIAGRLHWAGADLGNRARAGVAPLMILMFSILFLTVGALSFLVMQSRKRSERMAHQSAEEQERLKAALASVPHGICMFDGEKRLVFSNVRYAEMYRLPLHLVTPGTPLQSIFDYRLSIGNAPQDFPNYVTHHGLDSTTGGTLMFEFPLADGRTIRINHLSVEGGSYIASHEDISDAVDAERRVVQASSIDGLTHLPNRSAFRRKLDEALSELATGARLSIFCLDLDRFKTVNETLGHAAGDELLEIAAKRLLTFVDDDGFVARVGGDQFAMVQVNGDQPESARRLAQAALEALHQPFQLSVGKVNVEVSVGIALAPDHGNNADQLLENAEMAQYWVKNHGRGAYQFFDPAMKAATQTHHEIEAGLRSALDRGEFEVHYQPIINLKTGAVSCLEALLRWRHPQRGYIPPTEFIPVAEETGLIKEVGAWVLRTACVDAAKWPRRLRVAVNLSSVQFREEQLVLTVFKALSDAQLDATRLELEITESVLLDDAVNTVAILHRLREFGVRISMDDFGTGYSSLSYLRSFPFDKIKIDQSFVRDMVGSPESSAIVRAVIGLGNEFSLVTTAEGVETQEQLVLLRSAGCDEAQGFHISEARPVSELGEFLRHSVSNVASMAAA